MSTLGGMHNQVQVLVLEYHHTSYCIVFNNVPRSAPFPCSRASPLVTTPCDHCDTQLIA